MRGDSDLIPLLKEHLPHIHSGKVRESFSLGRVEGRKMRLIYVSDRISALDFVLGFPVPGKGIVLNTMNLRARSCLKDYVEHDIVAFGRGIDEFLKDYPVLQGIPELWVRCVVVYELDMIPYEIVVRGALTGSGFTAYQETGSVCGHELLPGARNGELLLTPLVTPTTKAADGGHDEPVNHQVVENLYPGLSALALLLYRRLHLLYIYRPAPGPFMADTKFEFGRRFDGRGLPHFVLADEAGTPDSSRFWDFVEYRTAWPIRMPRSYDKDPIRKWLRFATTQQDYNIGDLDPKNPLHQEKIKGLEPPPPELLIETLDGYQWPLLQLNESLETFWKKRGVEFSL